VADNILNFQDDLSKSYSERLAAMKQAVKLAEQQDNLTAEQLSKIRQIEALEAKLEKVQKRRLEALKGHAQKQMGIVSQQKQEIGSLESISAIYKNLTDSQARGLKISQASILNSLRQEGADSEKYELVQNILAETNKLTGLQQKLAELGPDDVEAQKSIRAQYAEQVEKINQQVGQAKAMGQLTGQQADIFENILQRNDRNLNIAGQYATISKETKEIIQKQIDAYKGIEKTLRGIIGTAKILFSGWRGFVGMTLIGAGHVMDKLGESVKSMGGYLGGATLSATALSFVFKDANQTAEALNRELGGMQDVTFGTQLNTNLMAMNMGISGDEAATLTANFARLNGNSTSIAADMAASTKALAKQKGVMPSAVMKDVAKSAKAFAEYGKDGGKNIAEAAVAAARLGVNMDSMTKVTDSLLDFEESINNELELGAMLGKSINLNRARALAFEGEIGAAVKETLNALGGQAEWEKMNIFQKRQAAKTLGLSVEEMDKMVKNQDKLNDDGTMQLTTFEKINESFTAFATTGLGSALKGMGAMVIAAGQLGTGLSALGIDMKGIVQSSFGFVKNMLKAAAVKVAGLFGKKLDFGSKKPEAPGLDNKTEDAANKVSQKGVGDKLKDLAKGLKAMGDGKVLFGALNLIPTGLGFLAMLPGLPSLFFLSKMNVSGVGKGLEDMAKGLKKMGDGKVFLGSLALVVAAGAFAVMTVGAIGMAAIAFLGVPTGIALTALGKGLKSFGSNALQGVLVLGLLAGVIALSALAFQQFAGIDWNGVIFGGLALAAFALGAFVIGKFAADIIVGAVAIAALGIALIPFAFAMSLLAGLSMDSVIAAAAGLVIFAGAVFALGAIMFTGVGAMVFGAGIIALIGLGIALTILGTGITILANGLNALGSSLEPVATSISTIMSSLGGIVGLIAPIALLSLALFGLASALIFLGSAGLIALPGIAALAAIQAITIGLADMLGLDAGGAGGEGKEDAQTARMDELIAEIKGLRADMQAGKIAVIMDGTKVTSKVSRVVDKQTGNSFRHS
jgi:triphosphoribosyl-dephospho-CoA synthetase